MRQVFQEATCSEDLAHLYFYKYMLLQNERVLALNSKNFIQIWLAI